MAAHLHFTEETFALHLFLKCAQCLIDVIVAYDDFYQRKYTPFSDIRLIVKRPSNLQGHHINVKSNNTHDFPNIFGLIFVTPTKAIQRTEKQKIINSEYLWPIKRLKSYTDRMSSFAG